MMIQSIGEAPLTRQSKLATVLKWTQHLWEIEMPYTAYIEEAGDEGLGKGSCWFIVGAVLVDKSKDLTVSRCIDEIKQRILIERISWFGADRADTVDLVFANRSNMLYCELKKYLSLLLNDRTCQIKPKVIDLKTG